VTPGIRRDPAPDLDAVGQDEGLVARIHEEIARDGPIAFARFMDLALYDPDGGYYRSEDARPGREGDFLTAPEAHPIFGAALARAVADAWVRLGRPETFVVREYGAGTVDARPRRARRACPRAAGPRARLRYDRSRSNRVGIEAIASRLEAAGHAGVLAERITTGPRSSGSSSRTRSSMPFRSTASSSETAPSARSSSGSRDGAFVDIEAEPTTPDLAQRLADESRPAR
jgi:hypothetical protein